MAGLNLSNVGFVGSLRGAGAAPPAAGTAFDPTVYDAAYLSWMGANTSTFWQDQSGKGRHLTTSGASNPFPYTPNVRNGKAAYVSTADQQNAFFNLPAISAVNADYTITVVFGITTATQFTALRFNDAALAFGRTYLGVNTAEIQAIYQNAGSGAVVAAVAGDTLLLTYQLNAATGATIRRNGAVAQTGLGYLAAKFTGGDAFLMRSGNIIGPIYALLISVGNRSAAQVAATEAYLTEQLAL